VDDLPDWLLDSDQIDQTDAPLGGGGDELPDLPDTLSDRVDDTVGGEKRAAASGDGLVADTVFFNPDEEGFFDQDDSPSADGKPDEDASEDEVHWPEQFDIDKDERAGNDQRDSTPPDAVATMEDPDHVEADIDWDDFNSEIEHEELLTGSDEKAIDAALAELEEPSPEPVEPRGAADPELAAEARTEDQLDGQDNDREDDREDNQGSAQADRSDGEPVLHPGLFKANSIGGIVGEHLDTRAATLIGEAIGSEAMSRGVNRMVVGRDGRLDGPQLMSALSQGLRSAGVDVVDIGAVPIPVLNFAATELTSGSGVMVTGSHYPANHNGFRIRIQNELLSDDGIKAIQRRIDTQDLSSGAGRLEEDSVIERYIERIGIDVQLERPLKVIVDCGNGIAGSVVPAILSAIGADVIPLYADVDGSFPNHLPDPSQPENLEDLKLCVRNFHADLGLAFDGDGDRLAAVAGDGQMIWTDRLLMLLVPDIIERNAGARVVIDSASSPALNDLIRAAGGKPLVERSAEAFVEQRMRKESALLGGLFSGHLFIAERWYPFDDAIYASARLLEVLAADTRSIAEIIGQLPQTVGTPELRVSLESGRAEDLITELIAEGDFGDAQLSMVDGLRADYPDGWGMVRASHQGRGLVLRFEAESSKALKRIKTTFSRQIAARDSTVKLQF
jgi:phosphomannomutase/phosphoglucomutase